MQLKLAQAAIVTERRNTKAYMDLYRGARKEVKELKKEVEDSKKEVRR